MAIRDKKTELSLKEFVLNIQNWFQYLIKKWLIILLVCLLGGAIGLWFSIHNEPEYTGSLSFVLEDDGTSTSGALGLASQFGFDVGSGTGGVFKGTNVIELFKSRLMVQKALLSPADYKEGKASLAEQYIDNQGWRLTWKDKPELANLNFPISVDSSIQTRIQDSILGQIYKNLVQGELEVSQKDKKISLITINVRSNNESFSKKFTETLAAIVSDFYVQTKSKKARENLDILEHQTDSIRGRLNGSIVNIAVAADQTFGLNPALNVKRIPSVKSEVDVQTNKALLAELIKQVELARINLRKETPLIQIIDTPILPLEMTKIGKTKGIVLGVIIAGFLIVTFLISSKLIKDVMNN